MSQRGKHGKLLFALVAVALAMVALSYAAVPLYRKFCSATGFGGTTQRVSFDAGDKTAREVAKPEVKDRWITVSFDGNVDASLPWEFGPDVKSVRVKLGEVTTVTYHARNKGSQPTVGTATFNVQPDKVGTYFDKIQCFCFTKQVLKPGESETLPVQFYIDPALADDHQSDDVQNITLSYTFFLAKDQSEAKSPSETKSNPSSPPSSKSVP